MSGNDGVDDVTILVNSSPDKLMALNLAYTNGFSSVSNTVLCARASMLLQVRSSSCCRISPSRTIFSEMFSFQLCRPIEKHCIILLNPFSFCSSFCCKDQGCFKEKFSNDFHFSCDSKLPSDIVSRCKD